ncbi:MAG TPA: hypothetical protein VNZ62_21760 [Capillimicrobium sp.]|nr:hypothetical protein [Capillimicrobium sp.]
MSDDQNRNSLEEVLRAVAQEVGRSIERISEIDLDELARNAGVDPDQAREWFDGASQWLRIQVERVEETTTTFEEDAEPATVVADDPLDRAAPHPLDLPTAEQGVALAALDSGRWSLEPGTGTFAVRGEGPAPQDALGLARELRVRDWVDADGVLTAAGHHALERWLRSAQRA